MAQVVVDGFTDESMGPVRICRFCLSEEGEEGSPDDFVEPCLCRGTQRSVHLGCLLQHFRARGDWHNLSCPTCKGPYVGAAACELAVLYCAQVNKEHGQNSLEFARSLRQVAHAHNKKGNARESKSILEKCITIEQNRLGLDHVDTVIALEEMADVCGKLGNVLRQKELLERCLAIREAHYGVGDINTAASLNNLATVCGDLGDVLQEGEMLQRCLAIKERCYGKSHWRNASTMSNLANVYCELGNATKGCELFQRALAIKQQHFGAGHVETATTLNNLALARAETGDFAEMHLLLEKSLAIKERQLGVDHLECCLILANLGLAYSITASAVVCAQSFSRRAKQGCASAPKNCRHCTVLLRAAAVHAACGEVSAAELLSGQALLMLRDVLGSAAGIKALNGERARTIRLWSAAGRYDMVQWIQTTWAANGWQEADSSSYVQNCKLE